MASTATTRSTATRPDYSRTAIAYFTARAIDPQLAWNCGVREHDGAIVWPTVDADGQPSPRRRSLSDRPGPKVRGAKGKTVGVWWPLGRPNPITGDVLICEGESDAMAAASVLHDADHVHVASGKASLATLIRELTALGARVAALGYDGDIAGATTAERHANTLVANGIGTRILNVPHGNDLASTLASTDDPRGWLKQALIKARPVGIQTAALVAENQWLRRKCIDLLEELYPNAFSELNARDIDLEAQRDHAAKRWEAPM